MQARLPDILCLSRAFLSFFLLALEPLSDAFLALYTFCWATDFLDGRIARSRGQVSPRGQVLDSSCDIVLGLVTLVCVIPHVDWEMWMIVWIAAIAAVRLLALGIGTGRFGKVSFIHTYFNKFAGFLFFLMPFLLRLFDTAPVAVFLLSATTVSAAEYLYITCTCGELDRNYRGLLFGTAKH